jgi:hypothetical protein
MSGPDDLVDVVYAKCMEAVPDAPPAMARMYAERFVACREAELQALLGDLDNWQPQGFLP